jgi:hypothetical protein
MDWPQLVMGCCGYEGLTTEKKEGKRGRIFMHIWGPTLFLLFLR